MPACGGNPASLCWLAMLLGLMQPGRSSAWVSLVLDRSIALSCLLFCCTVFSELQTRLWPKLVMYGKSY